MAIPDFQTVMLPLLTLANDGVEHPFREAVDRLADEFNLKDDERAELLPSGTAHSLTGTLSLELVSATPSLVQ